MRPASLCAQRLSRYANLTLTPLTKTGMCFQWNEVAQRVDLLTEKCGLHCSSVYDSCLVAFVVWAIPLIMGLSLIFAR